MVQSHLQIDNEKFKLYTLNPKATAKNFFKKRALTNEPIKKMKSFSKNPQLI